MGGGIFPLAKIHGGSAAKKAAQASIFPILQIDAQQERMIQESEFPIHDPIPMKIIFNLFLVLCHTTWLF